MNNTTMAKYLNLEHVIVFFVIIAIFRFPILASIGVEYNIYGIVSISNILSIGPFFVIMCAFMFNNGKDHFSNKSIMFLFVFLISMSSVAFLFVIGNVSIKEVIVYLSAHITISLMVYLLFNSDMSKRQYEELLVLIAKLVICLGGGWVLFEFVLIFFLDVSPLTIKEWLFQSDETFNGYLRVNGFLISKEISGACLLYSFACVFYFEERKVSGYTILATLSILACNSITLISSFVMLLFIGSYGRLRSSSILLLSMLILLIILKSSISERIISHILDTTFQSYAPKITGCISLLLGNNNLLGSCHPGEFHSLTPLIKFGLLPAIAWVGVVLYGLCCSFTFKNRQLAFFIPAVSFLLPMVHYGGGEVWGNNYIIAIILAYAFKCNNEKTQVPNITKKY